MRRGPFVLALALAPSIASAAPPEPTFHWAATELSCQARVLTRSNGNTCSDIMAPFVVAGFAPRAGETRVAVIRYEGDHVGAPQKWLAHVDLGASASEPVVLLHEDQVLVAASAGGAVQIAALDAKSGKVLRTARVFASDASRIQLEADKELRVYALGATARIAVLDPRTLAEVGRREVPLSAVRTHQVTGGQTTSEKPNDGTASASWATGKLVVKRGALTVAVPEKYQRERASIHATPTHTLLVLHYAMSSGAEAVALDARTGAVAWRREVTGLGPISHSKYFNAATSLVDGDQLVVQGVESSGAYVCTIGIADGVERACVDRLDAKDIVKP